MGAKKNLIIVESPAKAKTINRYLGKNYQVVASHGHLIDLPKSRLAVDIDHDFEPDYITVRGQGKRLDAIKKMAANAKEVLLATDSDREGEAISWHIKNAILKKDPKTVVRRIIFNEITKAAIQDAVKHPQVIDERKVNAQKARRILDRIVGYYISPFLWKKIKKGLSAGRVQSVALKIICDREEEIRKFVPEEYWTVGGLFAKGKSQFKAQLVRYEDEKLALNNEKAVTKLVNELKKQTVTISDIQIKERKRNPTAPYTTSKMQQDASTHFGFTSQKTMQIAQELYEGIDLDKERTGLITYMRTDSTRISNVAMDQVRELITSEFGDEYLPEQPNTFKNKKGSQDAHECIRPTEIIKKPADIKKYLTNDQYKLYNLIWEKFVSSQMKPAIYEQTQVEISVGKGLFRVTSSKVKFNGFLKVAKLSGKDDPEKMDKTKLPALKVKDQVKLEDIQGEQHFTEPPPRYNDASLIKKLDEEEIGRPSTYTSIIGTLYKRYYVQKRQKQLIPTKLGELTNQLVTENFKDIVNIKFTAQMEELLDSVENENRDWVRLLHSFYDEFSKTVDFATENVEKMGDLLDEKTDEVCELCGAPMLKKLGKNGYFLACSAFPECRNAKSLPLGPCPREGCDGQLVSIRMRGKTPFYGCTRYPDCDFITWDEPSERTCPKCGRVLFEKYAKDKGQYYYCVHTECGYEEK